MNNNAPPPSDRLALQRGWNDQKMANSIDWGLSKSSRLLFVTEHSTLVLWTYTAAGPQLGKVLQVTGVALSFRQGVMIELTDSDGAHYTINAEPRQHLPGVFLWTPAFSEVRFVPRQFETPDGPWHLTLALCLKTRSRSDQPVEGHTYLSPMKEFNDTWPGIF
jgi:hypothetical protein